MFSKKAQVYVLVAAIGLLVPVFALGDEKSEAKRHFVNGTEMMELEDFAGAAVEFEASLKLYRSKNAAFNLAMCYKALHKYPQALDMFRVLLKEFSADLTPEVKDEVRKNIRSMNKMISKVEITTNIPGATILLDGETIGTSPLPKPVLVGAGKHRIRVSLEGYHDQETSISVVSGKDQVVEFTLEEMAAGATAVAAPVAAVPAAPSGPPEDQVQAEQALGRSLAREYRYFTRSHLDKKMSFASYIYSRGRKKQIGGILHLALIAPIVQGVGLGLYFLVMSTIEDEDPTGLGIVDSTVKQENDARRGFAGALLGLCTVGTVITIIVGSVKTARGTKTKNRLKPLLAKEKKKAQADFRFAGIAPLADLEALPAGLSLDFRF